MNLEQTLKPKQNVMDEEIFQTTTTIKYLIQNSSKAWAKF
jgi:hypothetical protein